MSKGFITARDIIRRNIKPLIDIPEDAYNKEYLEKSLFEKRKERLRQELENYIWNGYQPDNDLHKKINSIMQSYDTGENFVTFLMRYILDGGLDEKNGGENNGK